MKFLLSFILLITVQALLYIAAEDEAFMAINREIDAHSRLSERKDVPTPSIVHEGDPLELIPLAGKNISEWLTELDVIAREVEAELVPRDIGCHLVEVIEGVNAVLFGSRGFKRLPVAVEPKCSYLHGVLSSGYGSGIVSLPLVLSPSSFLVLSKSASDIPYLANLIA